MFENIIVQEVLVPTLKAGAQNVHIMRSMCFSVVRFLKSVNLFELNRHEAAKAYEMLDFPSALNGLLRT